MTPLKLLSPDLAQHSFSTRVNLWLEGLSAQNVQPRLATILHRDITFFSPAVHTPYQGKMMVQLIVMAAHSVLVTHDFQYIKILDNADQAVLEFETKIDSIYINGVDIITWNAEGLITDFKVMIRPAKALDAVQTAMAAKISEMMQAKRHNS